MKHIPNKTRCINCVKSPIDVISRENTFCSLACAEAYVVRWRLELYQENAKTEAFYILVDNLPDITPTLELDLTALPYVRNDVLLVAPETAYQLVDYGYLTKSTTCGIPFTSALITLFHPKWGDKLQELCETHP